MRGDKAFVDTNILLRLLSPQMPLHQEAEALIRRQWENEVELWISRQVVREYLVQVTHPNTFSPSITFQQVMSQLEIIQTLFHIADETQKVTEMLLSILQTYPTRGKQIHDANIIATMMAYEIDTLLTINLRDFRRYASSIHLIGIGETAE